MDNKGKAVINLGKEYKIKTSIGEFGRHSIKTHFIKIGENYCDLIDRYIDKHAYGNDIIAISSKIISICQGNVVYKSDIKIGILSRFLKKFIPKSDTDMGINSVYKIQYAIDTYGKWNTFILVIGYIFNKIFFKRKSIFYDLIGKYILNFDWFNLTKCLSTSFGENSM